MTRTLNTKISKKSYTETLYYDMKLTEKYSKMFISQLLSKLNAPVTGEELLVLDIIYNSGEICQRDLAKLLLKDRANTGRLLDSLEKKEFLKRTIDTKNNRLVKKIILTEEGEFVLHDLMDKVLPVFNEISNKFSEEEIMYVKDVLKRLRETFNEIVKIQI